MLTFFCEYTNAMSIQIHQFKIDASSMFFVPFGRISMEWVICIHDSGHVSGSSNGDGMVILLFHHHWWNHEDIIHKIKQNSDFQDYIFCSKISSVIHDLHPFACRFLLYMQLWGSAWGTLQSCLSTSGNWCNVLNLQSDFYFSNSSHFLILWGGKLWMEEKTREHTAEGHPPSELPPVTTDSAPPLPHSGMYSASKIYEHIYIIHMHDTQVQLCV